MDEAPSSSRRQPRVSLLAALGPGMLVAATGVGAGDIIGAGFAGSHVGYMILWAAVLGAFIKFVINEGLTRWQLATGQTLLEGVAHRLGRPVLAVFLVYLVLWSFSVGTSLISACGVAAHALVPAVFDSAVVGKNVWGILHSMVALVLIFVGGYKRFEQLMTFLLVLMFVTIIATAAMIGPRWSDVLAGLVIPRLPTHVEGGLEWTLALMGGVGGTVTVLCYGYWIREQGRHGPDDLRLCRVDLAVAYAFTALFGISVVIIAADLNLARGGGATVMIDLADRLGQVLGRVPRWIFLLGAWGAMFTSLLGVWQAVPYLFADTWELLRQSLANRETDGQTAMAGAVGTRSLPYRVYLLLLATVPMLGLYVTFVTVQKINAIFGALVMPMLALALLIMNSRSDWVGRHYQNRPITIAVLVAVLLIFSAAGVLAILWNRPIVS